MTMRDSMAICDRCGGPAGRGGVAEALVVSDLNAENGMVLNLHFCRTRTIDGETTKGCDKSVLTPRNLEAFLENFDKYVQPEIVQNTGPVGDPQ